MTEDEARDRVRSIAGGEPAFALIERFATVLVEESKRQNLISASSVPILWQRHILDCVQLARFAREEDRSWIDIGSGAGLPGLVIACLGRWVMTLVEPRRRRADFLEFTAATLGLDQVTIVRSSAVAVQSVPFDIVSARAVGSVEALFGMTRGCADDHTRFVLPRGEGAAADVAKARRDWHGVFHVEHSATNASAEIVVAERVSAK